LTNQQKCGKIQHVDFSTLQEIPNMITKYELFSSSVSTLSRDIQAIERTEMAKFGLKGPHAQCLMAMNRFPQGITSAKLCDLCEKDKAAISRTVAELEEAGLIRRSDRNGVRYRSALTLTEAGKIAADAVNQRATQAVEEAGAGLNDEQREVFYSVLGIISENLHTICKTGLKER
jgi:DNA-binding MarR family transcriptional regulator